MAAKIPGDEKESLTRLSDDRSKSKGNYFGLKNKCNIELNLSLLVANINILSFFVLYRENKK